MTKNSLDNGLHRPVSRPAWGSSVSSTPLPSSGTSTQEIASSIQAAHVTLDVRICDTCGIIAACCTCGQDDNCLDCAHGVCSVHLQMLSSQPSRPIGLDASSRPRPRQPSAQRPDSAFSAPVQPPTRRKSNSVHPLRAAPSSRSHRSAAPSLGASRSHLLGILSPRDVPDSGSEVVRSGPSRSVSQHEASRGSRGGGASASAWEEDARRIEQQEAERRKPVEEAARRRDAKTDAAQESCKAVRLEERARAQADGRSQELAEELRLLRESTGQTVSRLEKQILMVDGERKQANSEANESVALLESARGELDKVTKAHQHAQRQLELAQATVRSQNETESVKRIQSLHARLKESEKARLELAAEVQTGRDFTTKLQKELHKSRQSETELKGALEAESAKVKKMKARQEEVVPKTTGGFLKRSSSTKMQAAHKQELLSLQRALDKQADLIKAKDAELFQTKSKLDLATKGTEKALRAWNELQRNFEENESAEQQLRGEAVQQETTTKQTIEPSSDAKQQIEALQEKVAQHEATINELEQQHKVLLHSAKTSATKTETGSRSERSKHDKQAAEITSLAEKARDAERRAKAQIQELHAEKRNGAAQALVIQKLQHSLTEAHAASEAITQKAVEKALKKEKTSNELLMRVNQETQGKLQNAEAAVQQAHAERNQAIGEGERALKTKLRMEEESTEARKQLATAQEARTKLETSCAALQQKLEKSTNDSRCSADDHAREKGLWTQREAALVKELEEVHHRSQGAHLMQEQQRRLQEECAGLTSQLRELESSRATITAASETQKAKLSFLETHAEALEKDKAQLQVQFDGTVERLRALERDAHAGTETTKTLTLTVANLEANLQEAEQDKARSQQQLDELASQVQAAEKESTAAATAQDAIRSELERKVEAGDLENNKLRTELEQTTARLWASEHDQKANARAQRELESKLDAAETQLAELRTQLEQTALRLEVSERDHEAAKEAAEVREYREAELEGELERTQEAQSKLQTRLDEAQELLLKLEMDHTAAVEAGEVNVQLSEQLEGKLQQAELDRAEAQARLADTTSRLRQVEREYEAATEAAEADAFEISDLKARLGAAEEEKAGLESQLVGAELQLESLEGTRKEDEEARRTDLEHKMSNLDREKQQLETQKDDAAAKLVELERHLRVAAEAAEVGARGQTEMAAKLATVESDNAKLRLELERASKESCAILERDAAQAQALMKQKDDSLENLTKQVAELTLRCEEAVTCEQKLKEEVIVKTQEVQNLTATLKRTSDSLAEDRKRYNKLEALHKQSQSENLAQKAALMSFETQLQESDNAVSVFGKQRGALEANIFRAEIALKNAEEQLSSVLQQRDSAVAKCRSLEAKLDSLENCEGEGEGSERSGFKQQSSRFSKDLQQDQSGRINKKHKDHGREDQASLAQSSGGEKCSKNDESVLIQQLVDSRTAELELEMKKNQEQHKAAMQRQEDDFRAKLECLQHKFRLPDAESALSFKSEVSFSVFHSYVQEFGTLEDAGMISKTNHGAASWVLFNSKELRLIGQTREDLDVTCDRKSVRKYGGEGTVFFIQIVMDGSIVNHCIQGPNYTMQCVKASTQMLVSGDNSLQLR